MKVKHLIKELQKLDPELDVLCYSEDEILLPKGLGFRLLEIDGVDETEGQKQRTRDNVPTLKLGKGPHSERLAFINVIADF